MAPDFETHLRAAGMSSNTVMSYCLVVVGFGQWYRQTNGQPVDVTALTRVDFRDYRNHLQAVERLKPGTINYRLTALKRWGEYLVATKQTVANPVADTQRVPEPQLAPRWPEHKQVAALERELERAVNNARTDPAKFQAVRDRAMILLLAHTGLRVSELCSLEPGDVTISERAGSLVVRHGKGNKRREVPVNREGRRALTPWLALRPASAIYLFTGPAGGRLSTRAVQYALKDYGRKAGVAITPHNLRHYFAKSLIDVDVPAATVAAILGHSSLDMTRRYTLPSQRDLERAVEKLEG